MFEHYIHEVIRTEKGTFILIDVVNTPDCNWEGAYAMFDRRKFMEWWEFAMEEESPYTEQDIIEYGEDADAFYNWEIVSSHHRKPEAAEKNLLKAIKNL